EKTGEEQALFSEGRIEQENDYEMISKVNNAKKQLDPRCVEIIDMRFGIRSSQFAVGSSQFAKSDKRIEKSEERSKLTPFEEVAEQLGITPDNARQRFKRCLERLIRLVRPESIQAN
ncbi:MAG: hypothetical protein HQ542_10080, partial [Bacteroidia bacterium]|nr:hypothetical protein [Bacteroidia bacterium]